jgi:peptidoglycan/LPS O-acetylase OafA/YrhL
LNQAPISKKVFMTNGTRRPLLAFLLAQHLLLSVLFASWALFMILNPTALAAPGIVVNVGKMSFSIYLLHFAVLMSMNALLADVWPFGMTGATSVLYAGILLTAAAPVSYQVARITYRFIEMPLIRYGKSVNIGGLVLSPRAR